MNERENMLSIAGRRGFERVPVFLDMCPVIQKKLSDYLKTHDFEIPESQVNLPGISMKRSEDSWFLENCYREKSFKAGTDINAWGVAHEPGSKYAYHMTYMHHPMENFDSPEQVKEYPFPVLNAGEDLPNLTRFAADAHKKGLFVLGNMQCTVWERAWYMRGMENLMCDMMEENEIAEVLLDTVTDFAVLQAETYVRAGADGLFLGDDIGMQRTIMMSEPLYRAWLQPRLKRVIDAARAIKKDIVIFYHSCGHVTELIPNLIEAGIDVLNPIQPEAMDFPSVFEAFHDRLSFHGTIGTQSVMPFGTPEDVRRAVFEHLDLAGKKGGLFVCPTHMLEPEVPLENVLAYVQACKDYTK